MDAPAPPQPAHLARMLALQRTVGNAAVAAHLLGGATNELARQPTTDQTTEPAAEGDVVPNMINPDDRAWNNAVERLKTITRVIMYALGRNDIDTILLQSENVTSTRYQLKAAAEAFPQGDIRRVRYEELSDHLYDADRRLFDLAHPSYNAISLWADLRSAAGILANQVNQDTYVDFKDQLYREAAWAVSKCERESNMFLHDRPLDKTKLAAQHLELSLAISRLDSAVANLPADDHRKLAREEAAVPLSNAQYRFVQLLSESVAAGDIWDHLRIASDQIDPAADPLPPNPYDEILAGMPDEAIEEAEENAP